MRSERALLVIASVVGSLAVASCALLVGIDDVSIAQTAQTDGGNEDAFFADQSSAEAAASQHGGEPGIACDGITCEAGAEVCCATAPSGQTACAAAADITTACEKNTSGACDDWYDCPGDQVCCGEKNSDGLGYYTSFCTSLVSCQTAVVPAVICDPDTTNGPPCPNDIACEVSDGGRAAFCVGLP